MKVSEMVIKIKEQEKSRQTRSARPFVNFMKKVDTANKLYKEIRTKINEIELVKEAKNQFIIVLITAFEVYFRDLFKVVFKLCNNEKVYEGCLRINIDQKFTLKDLIHIYKDDLKIEDIILQCVNFQNMYSVDEVFSALVNKKVIAELSVGEFVTGGPKKLNISLPRDWFKEINELLDLRHKTVHDINFLIEIDDKRIEKFLNYLYIFITIFDIYIHRGFIEPNLREVFVKKSIK